MDNLDLGTGLSRNATGHVSERPVPRQKRSQAGTSRPRRYCGDACRKAAYRARSRKRPIRSDWWTPPELAARIVAAHRLGLDAAACPDSTLVPDNWLGTRHVDPRRRDALSGASWAALAPPQTTGWLNPPYLPTTLLRGFLGRAARTAEEGIPVVALVPASTSSSWWHDLVIDPGATVEFLRGRLIYGGPHSTGGSTPWPSALVHYGGAPTGLG